MNVMFSEMNTDTIDVLKATGCEIYLLKIRSAAVLFMHIMVTLIQQKNWQEKTLMYFQGMNSII
jgi:hypothetical protein